MNNKIKISLSLIASVIALASCKKTPDPVSTVVDVSYPTITITGQPFYSIPVGGSVPTIQATAYDSLLKETCSVTLDASGLDNSTPGLQVVAMQSKNSNGYIAKRNVFVAVTDIDPSWNLSGEYQRTSNGASVFLTKVANGLYEVDNVGGAPTFPVVAYFCQLNDSTLDLPMQPTVEAGDLDCTGEKLIISGTDTSYQWTVRNAFFGTAVRTFVKQ